MKWTSLADPVSIQQADVLDLLALTSTNNATGLIGSPYSITGYSLTGAQSIAARCTQFKRGTFKGRDAVAGLLPGHGVHVWYINTQVRLVDPWK